MVEVIGTRRQDLTAETRKAQPGSFVELSAGVTHYELQGDAYNGTAPIEYSSGGNAKHRLSLRGNRALNHAIHMTAIAQISKPTSIGWAYYTKKTDGKTKKEALRALKRRISNVVYRRLQADQKRATG